MMDELKRQEFSVSPGQQEEEQEEQEDGFMEDCNSGSGSDSRSVFISKKLLEKNRLRIRIKMRNSEDCNGESGNVSNETSSTMNVGSEPCNNEFVGCGEAKNRAGVTHHGSTKGEGVEKLPDCSKKRRPELKNQLENHRRRTKSRPIKLEFKNREEKAWSGKSVTEVSCEEDDDDDDSSPLEKSKPMCSLCGKNFPSMKSLFGHMRCHPDRVWRGMVPPEKIHVVAEKNSPPSSAVSDSSPDFTRSREEKTVDQVSSLSSWSVTARRGRISTISDSQDFFAAYHLMMLANGDWKEQKIEVKKGKSKGRNSVPGSRTVKKIEENKLGYRSEQRKRKRKIKTLEKVQNLALIDSKLAEKYRCNTCNKSFSSHQALGGHRASHKKGKNSSSCQGRIDEFSVDDAAEEGGYLMVDLTHMENSPESGGQPWPENDILHRCQICNKGFPTGQALGGHKRCHWTGDKQASSVTSVEIPPDEQKTARGLPDFDLNMPPMVEEEDLDSAISKTDAVPASCQSLGLKFKDHASFYCSSVI